MSATENASEFSLPSTEYKHQALMITVSNEYKESFSLPFSLSDFSQNTTLLQKLRTLLLVQTLLSIMKWKLKKTLVALL